jgi:signal transduction histidine kinase
MRKELSSLRESNDFIISVLNNITSGVFIVDEKAVIYDFNSTLKAIFNENEIENNLCGNALGCGNLAGTSMNCGETEHCQNCTLRNNIFETLAKKVPVYKEKLIRSFVINGELSEKTLLYSTKFIEYHGKQMVLVIVDDITELEDQRKHLEALNEEKDRFLGIAAHDLRNPLSAIVSIANLLHTGLNDYTDEKKLFFLNLIKESGDSALHLINDLLDLSKIESGKLSLFKEDTDYKTYINELLVIEGHLAEKKEIDIIFNNEKQLPLIQIDKRKIKQVFSNLISNSIKFSHRNTTISIFTEHSDDQIITTITDQGQGIPENEIENIFMPFEKTSVQTTENEKSTGLGLAIVKKIVEVHGGKIWVESTVNVGTSISFSLPVSI